MASFDQTVPSIQETRSRPIALQSETWGFAVLLAVVVFGPFFLSPMFMMQVMCFGLLACSVNLLLGYGGLLSFGHSVYFGSAGYLCAYGAKIWGLTPELAILLGTMSAVALGTVMGALAIRRQGIYFAMVTLTFGQLVYFISLQTPATGGEDGLQAIPRGKFLGLVSLDNDMALYCLVAVIFMLAYALSHRIIQSPFGQVLLAIRSDERRAVSLGYRADRYKLLLFILSSLLAGLGGSMKAIVFQLVSLTDVHWSTSGEALLMVLIGGVGTLFGPLVGAAVTIAMQNYLASLGEWITVIQGGIFVFVVLVFRAGLVGTIAKWLGIKL